MPLHGEPAVPLAEAMACPGPRGYECVSAVWPAARVALAVTSAGAAVRELASRIEAHEIWELPEGSGPALLETLAREAGRRMGRAARLAVSSPWCVLAGDARDAAEIALARFASGSEAVATCREVEPHPSVYRLGRCLEDGDMAWRAYSYAGAFRYSPLHRGFIDPQERPLFRRQDFPPLHELDYGLVAGSAAGLAALHARMEEQPDILVPNHDSILLMGLLDVVRAEVLARDSV